MSDLPHNSEELRQRGRSDSLVERVANAERVLVDLEYPQSRELRGKPSLAIREQTQNFIEHDHVCRSLEDLYVVNNNGEQDARDTFREAVGIRIRTFETLAARNPDIYVKERLDEDTKWAHRRLAIAVYDHLGKYGPDVSRPSIFRLDYMGDLQPEEERQPTSRKPRQRKTVTAVEPEPTRKPEGDTELFHALVDFLDENCERYAELDALYNRIQSCLDQEEETEVRDILLETVDDNPHLLEELARIQAVIDDCDHQRDNTSTNVFELYESAKHIEDLRERPPYGFVRHDPYAALVDEGYLTEASAQALSAAYDALEKSTELTRTIVEKLDERGYQVTTDEVLQIDSTLLRLEQAGFSHDVIAGRVLILFSSGTQSITHLENLASFAEEGVDVRPFINVSARGMQVIAAIHEGVKQGVYRSPVSGKNIPKHIEQAIWAKSRSAAQVSSDTYNKVQRSLNRQGVLQDQKTDREVEEALLLVASQVQNIEDGVLRGIRHDLHAISASGGDLKHLQDFFRDRHPRIAPQRFIHFVQDLAELHRNKVDGVGRLLKDAHYAWRDEQAGKAGANMSGFLTEAKVELDLIRHGYKLKEISLRRGIRFPYDAVGLTPEGAPCAIEIKNSLGTLSNKEKENLEDSQIVEFTRSANREGLEPIIVVPKMSPGDHWAVVHLQSLYERMQGELQVDILPRVIASQTNMRIPIR